MTAGYTRRRPGGSLGSASMHKFWKRISACVPRRCILPYLTFCGFAIACLGVTSHSLAFQSELSTTPDTFVSKILAIARHGDLADIEFVEKIFEVTFDSVPADRPDIGVVADRLFPKSNLRFLLAPEIFYYRVAKLSRGRQPVGTVQFSLNPKALCVRREHVESMFGRGKPLNTSFSLTKGLEPETDFKGSNYHFKSKNSLSVSFYFGGRFCLGAISIMQNPIR